MTMNQQTTSALANARQNVEADACDQRVMPAFRTRLFEPQHSVVGAVLLLPGYTSPTDQFADLAQILADRGYYAYIPRAPRHGVVDGPLRIAPTAPELQAYARSGADIVMRLCPGSSGAIGLSGGAVLAAWLTAQSDIQLNRLLLLNPFLEPARRLVPKWRLHLLLAIYGTQRWLPDRPDPTHEARTFAGLASYLLLARSIPRQLLPIHIDAALITAPGDDQVDLAVAAQRFQQWFPSGRHYQLPRAWNLTHDIAGRSSLEPWADTVYDEYANVYCCQSTGFQL